MQEKIPNTKSCITAIRRNSCMILCQFMRVIPVVCSIRWFLWFDGSKNFIYGMRKVISNLLWHKTHRHNKKKNTIIYPAHIYKNICRYGVDKTWADHSLNSLMNIKVLVVVQGDFGVIEEMSSFYISLIIEINYFEICTKRMFVDRKQLFLLNQNSSYFVI